MTLPYVLKQTTPLSGQLALPRGQSNSSNDGKAKGSYLFIWQLHMTRSFPKNSGLLLYKYRPFAIEVNPELFKSNPVAIRLDLSRV